MNYRGIKFTPVEKQAFGYPRQKNSTPEARARPNNGYPTHKTRQLAKDPETGKWISTKSEQEKERQAQVRKSKKTDINKKYEHGKKHNINPHNDMLDNIQGARNAMVERLIEDSRMFLIQNIDWHDANQIARRKQMLQMIKDEITAIKSFAELYEVEAQTSSRERVENLQNDDNKQLFEQAEEMLPKQYKGQVKMINNGEDDKEE